MARNSKDHEEALSLGNDMVMPEDVLGGISLTLDDTPEPIITITDDGFDSEMPELEYADTEDSDSEDEIEDDDSHDANLAESLDESYLNKIGEDIKEKVKADIASRKPWLDRFNKGLEALGIVDDPKRPVPFEGAASVTYPLLMDAVIQFQARSIGELFPPTGPVKTQIKGDPTPEIEEQSDRVANYLNYQILEEDKGYFEELDQMLLLIPIAGSSFKKTYFDDTLDTVISALIKAEDFVVPYTATSLETAPRFTHKFHVTKNDMAKRMYSGFYRDCELDDPTESGDDGDQDIESTTDDLDGRDKVLADDDDRFLVYEMCIDYDIEGFEDIGDDGDTTGIALPYIISVEKNSGKVLAIRRNWKEDDELKRKIIYITHYRYLPGVGFYGFGLYHVIGGLSDTATGAVRALLDAAAFSTMQGGFRSKDVSGGNLAGDLTLSPGEYKEVGLSYDELSKAFYTPNFKEPSMALFKLLEMLISAGEKTSSLTEAMIGTGGANTPVGTELARIEQGSKVQTAIHKRLHRAMGEELRLRAELNRQWLSDDEYPYYIVGESRSIRGSDFDDRIDVVPVSDPSIASASLRIAKAQSVRQMANEKPELYNAYEVEKRMLEAQDIGSVDELLINRTELPRLDVVAQIQAIMMQQDVKAFADQDHTAHIKVISAFMEHPSFGGDEYIKQLVMPRLLALLAQHKAYEFGQIMGQQGAEVSMVDLSAENGQSILVDDEDPEMQDRITQSALEVVEGFKQAEAAKISQGQEQEGPSPEQMKIEAEIAGKQARTEAEIAAGQAKTQADIQGKQALNEADLAAKQAAAKADQERKDYESEREENRKDVELSNKQTRGE